MKDWEGEVTRREGKKMKSPVVMRGLDVDNLDSCFSEPVINPIKEAKKEVQKVAKEIGLSKKKPSKNKKIF